MTATVVVNSDFRRNGRSPSDLSIQKPTGRGCRMKTAISFESHEMVLSSRQIQASCSQSQPEIDDQAGQIKNFRGQHSVTAGEFEEIAENRLADVEPQSLHEPGCSCCVIASVRRSWSSSGYAVLRGIEGRFEDGVLVIRGSVSSYYYKQIAQELARRIDGVERIVNELTVSYRTTTKSEHDNQQD